MIEERWDVVIVGAGTAGIPCALAAADQGARVCVVEKEADVGGTLHVSGGHMSAGGTRRQRERGITDSPERHLADLLRITRGTINREIARVAVEEAPHTLDWLDDLGFPFEAVTPSLVFGHEPYDTPRTYWGANAAKDILATLRPEWERRVQDGAITLLAEHTLEDLLVESGEVVGVRVRGADGVVELRAGTVALTTGGYASNPELFAERTGKPFPLVSVAPLASQGEGIVAAERIGAAFRGADLQLPTAAGIAAPRGSGRSDYWAAFPNLMAPDRPPREIYVDAAGRRFLNEDDQSPDHRERVMHDLPNTEWWVIFDDASIDDGAALVPNWGGAGLRAKAAEGDVAWVSDDLRELARMAGIDPHGLMRTVAGYNEAVRSGHDPLGRTSLKHPVARPPYYALLISATTFITFGGLAIDAEQRVLDDRGRPIPGLYAAGEIIGAAATSGNAFCGGMLVTPALSLGRRLGRAIGRAAATVAAT
jgi:succinate dehydrogenase/fumarate reductase flavoprotein subunit